MHSNNVRTAMQRNNTYANMCVDASKYIFKNITFIYIRIIHISDYLFLYIKIKTIN